MHGKEFIRNMMVSYFSLVTLITVVIFAMGLYLEPDARFGYDAFAAPLIYGACGILPNAVMYTKRELTVKEFLVRKVIQFILIEAIVLFVAFYGSDIRIKQKEIIIGVGVSVFIVYVVSHIIDWVLDYVSARRMTEELIKMQQSVNGREV